MNDSFTAPVAQLKTNRGWFKYIFFSLITLGIYGIVTLSSIGNDVNLIATRYDGKKTMHYCLLFFVFAPITLGIAGIVWFHRISKRIGDELVRRGLPYKFGAGSYWGWNTLGLLLAGIGPIIYLHKLCKSMNLLCADYNARG